MNQTRYIYDEIPIFREDALEQRRSDLDDLNRQIKALNEEVDGLLRLPLPTTRQVQIELNPGDVSGLSRVSIRAMSLGQISQIRRKTASSTRLGLE